MSDDARVEAAARAMHDREQTEVVHLWTWEPEDWEDADQDWWRFMADAALAAADAVATPSEINQIEKANLCEEVARLTTRVKQLEGDTAMLDLPDAEHGATCPDCYRATGDSIGMLWSPADEDWVCPGCLTRPLTRALIEIDTYLANDPDVWRIVSVAKAGDVLCEVLGAETIQAINAQVEANLCASCSAALAQPQGEEREHACIPQCRDFGCQDAGNPDCAQGEGAKR